MVKIILTEGNTERLKILSFLFRVSGHRVEIIGDLHSAVASFDQLWKEGQQALLIVVDYHHLGQERQDRFEKLSMLSRWMVIGKSIMLAAHRWTDNERGALIAEVRGADSFQLCHSHEIVDYVNRFCSPIKYP